MRNFRLLAVGIGGILVAFGLLGWSASAQQKAAPTTPAQQKAAPATPAQQKAAPATAAAGTLGNPCNLLHDSFAPTAADPTAIDSSKLEQLDTAARSGILTSGLPCADITSGSGTGTPTENRQRGFDFYSWLTFLALNSPASNPKGIETSRANMPAVWEDKENFIPLLDVMLPGGAKPDWKTRIIPPACQAEADRHPDWMVVKMIEESFNQPFKTGPLIDQRNNYAIFDILMNKAMFKYILDHELYSQAGQTSEKNARLRVDFPAGTNSKDAPDPGSIMIKVSWRILDPEDDKSKFHHVEALVSMPRTPDEQSDPPCLHKTIGLVGFHVVHKTDSRPQWIWTSFEHIDNVPEQKDIDALKADPVANKLTRSYNFFDRSCTADCPANETPPRPWDPEHKNGLKFRLRADGKVLFNSQIVRTVNLTEATNRINAQFHSILGNTVWKNYILIGTQWPSDFTCTSDKSQAKDVPSPFTDFDKQPDMNCAPTPTFLANSTLETFSQGTIPQASSSCMACHGNAVSFLRRPEDPKDATTDPKEKFMNQSDFTFMLEKAR